MAVTIGTTLTASRPAIAQPASEADALFEQGLEDMRAGRYEVACPRLAQSYKVDPMPGALFTLAECEAAWGKTATAIQHYQGFVRLLTTLPPARRDKFGERRGIALEKLAALAALVPQLTVDVAPEEPAGLVVKANGVVVAPSAYGVDRQVDPGDYAVTAEMDGKILWRRGVHLGERDHARVAVPAVGADAKESEGARPEAAPAQAPTQAAAPSSSRSTWAWVAAGVGGAGLIAGGVAGAIALSDKGTIDSDCPNRVCTPAGRSAVSSGQGAALASTIGFGVGLAGLAGAALLWLTAPTAAARPGEMGGGAGATAAWVRPTVLTYARGAGAGVQGAF